MTKNWMKKEKRSREKECMWALIKGSGQRKWKKKINKRRRI